MAGPEEVIVPVFGVHRSDREALLRDLSRRKGVDCSSVFQSDSPTSRLFLHPEEEKGWKVCTKDIAPPIPFDRIRRHLDADAVLVNMVSGLDLTLETLDEIRMTIRGRAVPMHFDYHNLTLGIDAGHERMRRPLPEWRRWAFMIDTVQLNQYEAATLALERLTEEQTAGHLLTLGVKGVLVTRGPDGVTLYDNDHKHVRRRGIPGVAIGFRGAIVGCGDVFGAAFLMSGIRGADLMAAATAANAWAAAYAQRVQSATGDPYVADA
jgi:sugar/nucleoside kinase (ribokinase family)